MLIPVFETYGTIESYPVSAVLTAQATKELRDSVNLNLNLPYGNQNTVFCGGMIGQMLSEAGATVVQLTDGTSPFFMFADSFVDTLKSGMASLYLLCQNNIFKCKSNYDISQTYAVNTLLTAVPSGVNRGKLTPASNYASQPIVAIVMEPPANAANDDIMKICTRLDID
ncbi:MAG: hypothetical protein PHS93_08255 [Candidatus Omnitrophica bacterium]|nr:hypothetical protein [Candidatus Omnitrophota bacterium]MDD5589124.1 hypothetical protein [Candidatus Nanoarchaeia archaeon]